MQPSKTFTIPPRNLKTQAQHRREVFWQITVPLLFFLLLLLGAVSLVVWSGIQASPEVSRWADVSLVWLIIPGIVSSFLMLLLLAAIAFGVIKLIQVIPGYARLVQDFFLRVQARVSAITDQLVGPVIKARSAAAGARRLRNRLTGKNR